MNDLPIVVGYLKDGGGISITTTKKMLVLLMRSFFL